MHEHASYLGQRSFRYNIIVRGHSQSTDCSTWTTEVVGKKQGLNSEWQARY